MPVAPATAAAKGMTTRRRFIRTLAQSGALLSCGSLLPASGRATNLEDARFIARALELARIGHQRGDGTPYGALVVRDGTVIAEAWNRAFLKRDATAHAEVEVIQSAAQALGRRDLAGCTLYTNGGRPCPMCEGAAWFANLDRLVYARSVDAITDAGRPRIGDCA